MTLDDFDSMPPLTEEELNIIDKAQPTPSDDRPAMTKEDLKEFRPWYASQKTISVNIDVSAVEYFRVLSSECGVPYQSLINMYLLQCKEEKKKPVFV